jgi:hypothetical protein
MPITFQPRVVYSSAKPRRSRALRIWSSATATAEFCQRPRRQRAASPSVHERNGPGGAPAARRASPAGWPTIRHAQSARSWGWSLPSSSASGSPARGHRVKGAPAGPSQAIGYRLSLDPAPAPMVWAPIRKTDRTRRPSVLALLPDAA